VINRDQVKQLMFVIDNEYDIFKGNQEQDKLKVDTWYTLLQEYKYEQIQGAVKVLLSNKIYGKPKISDLLEILKSNPTGEEFADSLMDLLRRYGVDNMGYKVKNLWGEIGYSIFMSNRQYMREMLNDEVNTFKAQVRELYNSYKIRKERGTLEYLPHIQGKDPDITRLPAREIDVIVIDKPSTPYRGEYTPKELLQDKKDN